MLTVIAFSLLSGCIDNAEAGDYSIRGRGHGRLANQGGTRNMGSFAPDGFDEFVRVADSARFDGDNNSFTVCGFFRESTWAVDDTLVIKSSETGPARQWAMKVDATNRLLFQICMPTAATDAMCSNNCIASGNTFLDNTAVHLCFRYDGAGGANNFIAQMWINGNNSACNYTGTFPTTFVNTTSPIDIGAYNANNAFGAGFLDEIVYFNDALIFVQINQLCCGRDNCGGVCSAQTAGRADSHGISSLQLYLRFDNDPYPTATDTAGGDDPGTYTNTEAGDNSPTLP